jgi:tetratricopeptide (TPR) repeat protein
MEAGMTLAMVAKSAFRAVRAIGLQTIAVMLYVGPCHAEGHKANTRNRAYCGSATVSVATLQVPEQAWKHFEKARALALKQHAADSERESEKALAIYPKFAAAHILEASEQLVLKDYKRAVENVLAARNIDPDTEWAGVVLAGAYNGLSRFDEALTVLQELQGPEATSWQAKYENARAEIGLGDEQAALKVSAEALELAPKDFTDAKLMRANALMLSHRWTEARDCLNAYLATPGPQLRREHVLKVLEIVNQQAGDQPETRDSVNLASR